MVYVAYFNCQKNRSLRVHVRLTVLLVLCSIDYERIAREEGADLDRWTTFVNLPFVHPCQHWGLDPVWRTRSNQFMRSWPGTTWEGWHVQLYDGLEEYRRLLQHLVKESTRSKVAWEVSKRNELGDHGSTHFDARTRPVRTMSIWVVDSLADWHVWRAQVHNHRIPEKDSDIRLHWNSLLLFGQHGSGLQSLEMYDGLDVQQGSKILGGHRDDRQHGMSHGHVHAPHLQQSCKATRLKPDARVQYSFMTCPVPCAEMNAMPLVWQTGRSMVLARLVSDCFRQPGQHMPCVSARQERYRNRLVQARYFQHRLHLKYACSSSSPPYSTAVTANNFHASNQSHWHCSNCICIGEPHLMNDTVSKAVIQVRLSPPEVHATMNSTAPVYRGYPSQDDGGGVHLQNISWCGVHRFTAVPHLDVMNNAHTNCSMDYYQTSVPRVESAQSVCVYCLRTEHFLVCVDADKVIHAIPLRNATSSSSSPVHPWDTATRIILEKTRASMRLLSLLGILTHVCSGVQVRFRNFLGAIFYEASIFPRSLFPMISVFVPRAIWMQHDFAEFKFENFSEGKEFQAERYVDRTAAYAFNKCCDSTAAIPTPGSMIKTGFEEGSLLLCGCLSGMVPLASCGGCLAAGGAWILSVLVWLWYKCAVARKQSNYEQQQLTSEICNPESWDEDLVAAKDTITGVKELERCAEHLTQQDGCESKGDCMLGNGVIGKSKRKKIAGNKPAKYAVYLAELKERLASMPRDMEKKSEAVQPPDARRELTETSRPMLDPGESSPTLNTQRCSMRPMIPDSSVPCSANEEHLVEPPRVATPPRCSQPTNISNVPFSPSVEYVNESVSTEPSKPLPVCGNSPQDPYHCVLYARHLAWLGLVIGCIYGYHHTDQVCCLLLSVVWLLWVSAGRPEHSENHRDAGVHGPSARCCSNSDSQEDLPAMKSNITTTSQLIDDGLFSILSVPSTTGSVCFDHHVRFRRQDIPRKRRRLKGTCRGKEKDKKSLSPPTATKSASASAGEQPSSMSTASNEDEMKALIRKRRVLFNAFAVIVINQDVDNKQHLIIIVDELIKVTKENAIAKYKPKEIDGFLSTHDFSIVLMSIAVDLNAAVQSGATVGNRDVVQEVSCVTALASELIMMRDSANLSAMVEAVVRRFNSTTATTTTDVIKCLYQLGLAHMRVSLTKSSQSGQTSSDEVHLHSKRACDYMRTITRGRREDGTLYYSACLTIAQCETILQRYADSLKSYDDILEELSTDDNLDAPFYVCEAYLGRGEIKLRIREPQKALVIFKQAYNAASRLRTKRDRETVIMKALNKIGACYRDLNKMDLSVENYTESLRYAEKITHEVGISTVSAALGSIYESMGNPKMAQVYYRKQYDSAKRTNDHSLISLAAGNLGNVLVLRNEGNDLKKARELLNIGLDRAERIGNQSEVGRATCNIGNVLYAEQNYAESLKMFRKACQLSIEHMDRIGQQRACGNIGNVYMSLEQPSLARDWYELARNLSPQSADTATEASTCYNVGCCYLSLHLNEPESPTGQRYLLQGEENFHSSVSLYEDMYNCIGGGRFSDVLKLSLFEGYVKAFRQLQFIYCTRGQHEVALEMAERCHGMTFSDMLMHQLDNPMDADDFETMPTPLSSAEISAQVKQQTSTVLIFSVCHDQLQTWVVNPHSGSITFRCKVVNPTQQLVSSSTGTDAILQRLVSETMESVMSHSDVENDYNNDIGVPIGLGRLFDVLIGHISNLLPQPFIGEELVIVPCSALVGVSFGALFDTKSSCYMSQMYATRVLPTCRMLGKPPPLAVKRLFEPDGTATELDDAHQYNVLAVGSPEVPALQVNGNDDDKAWSPPPLPFARREAVNVARHFGCRPLLGRDAHKDAVLAQLPRARLVHLATHSVRDQRCVLVAPSPDCEDLSGEELVTACTIAPRDLEFVQIRADLVVLSACPQPGSGDSGPGPVKADGIIGLGRAFLLAGAQAVLVTLWDIPDEATELLMRCFYHLARQPGWTGCSAMQHAMHEVRSQARFNLPRYWAGFEMIGRQVLLDFQRPLDECRPFWRELVPRSLSSAQELPLLHTDIFDYVTQWLQSASSPPGMIVNGPSATGKSVLACQIAKYYKCVFGECQVVWLDFRNAASLRRSATCSLEQWNSVIPPPRVAEEEYIPKSSLAQLLEAMSRSSFGYLLVLDDVDDVSVIQFLHDVMRCVDRSASKGVSPRLLATSRAPILADEFAEFRQFSTSLLSAEDSMTVTLQLTALSNPSPLLNDCDSFNLMELCRQKLSAGYPLMVDQLAERVGIFPSCSFTSLRRKFEDPYRTEEIPRVDQSDLRALQRLMTTNSMAPMPNQYHGMDPQELAQVNLPQVDDGSDSGFEPGATDEPLFALKFMLSALSNHTDVVVADVDEEEVDVDVGDLLRCFVHATSPLELPLLFVARQVSQCVYDDANRIFVESGFGSSSGSSGQGDDSSIAVAENAALADHHWQNGGELGAEFNRETRAMPVYVTLDGLHGWLSLLDLVDVEREERPDEEHDRFQHSRIELETWRSGSLRYSYSTTHALETTDVGAEERDRRLMTTARAIASFLHDSLTCDFATRVVEQVLDAGLHLAGKIIQELVQLSSDSVVVLKEMLSMTLKLLLGMDDAEGRFAQCLELQLRMEDHSCSCLLSASSTASAAVASSVSVVDQFATDQLLLELFVACKWTADVTNSKAADLHLRVDHHLVVVASQHSVSAALDAPEAFGVDTCASSMAAMESSTQHGFEILSSDVDGRISPAVSTEEVFRLMYALVCLHSKTSPVCSGVWKVDESGIVARGTSLHLLVFDCYVLESKSLIQARTVGLEQDIVGDVQGLGKFAERVLLSSRAGPARDSSIGKLDRFVRRCSRFKGGGVNALWQLAHDFSEESVQGRQLVTTV